MDRGTCHWLGQSVRNGRPSDGGALIRCADHSRHVQEGSDSRWGGIHRHPGQQSSDGDIGGAGGDQSAMADDMVDGRLGFGRPAQAVRMAGRHSEVREDDGSCLGALRPGGAVDHQVTHDVDQQNLLVGPEMVPPDLAYTGQYRAVEAVLTGRSAHSAPYPSTAE
ncbi:hypothetical protein [Actinacidiphila alni]|uniref:hypothetical protein n=1 Tax=Actinacidiphila alni TaxID=380248 RepID=UPI00345179CA